MSCLPSVWNGFSTRPLLDAEPWMTASIRLGREASFLIGDFSVLDGPALELYRFSVSRPGWTKEQASDALGYTLREIDAAVSLLLEQRLLEQSTSADTYVAMSPDVALAELVDEDERTLQDLRSRINARRRAMSSLVPAYIEARKLLAADTSVEVLEDPNVIRRVLIDYGRDVREHVLMAQPGQGFNADVQEESIRKDLDLLESGVKRKTIYHNSIEDHVPTRKAVAAITAAGGEFRTLPHVPLRLLIFDEKLALVARERDRDDLAALVLRDPNIIHVLTRLFEVGWEIARPFALDEPAPSALNSVQRAILKGLAAGYSDEVLARRLDISVRTCRRHIAWMLEELGAESRFQAALKARDAGWI